MTGILSALFWLLGWANYSGYYAQTLNGVSIPPDDVKFISRGAFQFIYMAGTIVYIALGYFFISMGIQDVLFRELNKIKTGYLRILLKSLTSFLLLIISGILLAKLLQFTQGIQDTKEYLLVVALSLLLSGTESMQGIDDDLGSSKSSQYFVFSIRISALLITFMILLAANLYMSVKDGMESGCETIYNNSAKIVIYSKEPLPLTGKNNGLMFVYDGYFLSYQDNANYYIYNQYNSETMKPSPLFIIRKDQVNTLSLENVIPANTAPYQKSSVCKKISDQYMMKFITYKDDSLAPTLTTTPTQNLTP